MGSYKMLVWSALVGCFLWGITDRMICLSADGWSALDVGVLSVPILLLLMVLYIKPLY